MDPKLLEKLSVITDEEKAILSGNSTIDRAIYYSPGKSKSAADEVDAAKVLENGRLIDIRPHVRFVHFPKHTHNYVEFIYMCRGTTTHIIDGQTITLEEGDLLFLNQHAAQEILPAGEEDIAVNFMILPEFFDPALHMISSEESALKDFIVSCLTDADRGVNSLYFRAGGILPVRNIMESLIWTMFYPEPHRRTICQTAMSLLFLYLMDHAECIRLSGGTYDQDVMLQLLNYIETEYKDASMADFAAAYGIDYYALGRLIRKNTGRTFRDLLQQKRLSQASFLLKNTPLTVDEVSAAVGYDNTSFFHRLFYRVYGVRPKEYRQH